MTEGACTVEETTRARALVELMQQRPTGVVSTLDLLPLVRDDD
jgi:hypothetical protein